MKRWLLVCLMIVTACAETSSNAKAESDAVHVFGPLIGPEADAFAASLEGFEAETGIEVVYTGTVDFVSDMRERVANGFDEPDVALVPQPGFITELVDSGALEPLDPDVADAVAKSSVEDGEAMSGAEDYVVPYRVNLKSIVWYRPGVFEREGWEIPASLEELHALVDTIAQGADMAPWCFSISSGTATGWAATDWVEDLVLRRHGVEVYNDWANGEIGFGDERIEAAFEEFRELVLDRGRSVGGLRRVVQTEVARASEPLFTDSPGCALYKQAPFARSWFPDIEIGVDGDLDFFVLPGVDASSAAPLVVAGTSAVQLDGRNEVDQLMAHLASPEGAASWARRGGFISARSTVDTEAFYDDADQRFADLLLSDRPRAFDASDVMSPNIGSGLLWERITQWVSQPGSYDEMAQEIDEARSTEG